ncbi:hypothetical protein QYF61_024163 [Mycteria americana]|uniref:Uncharacterized protein n=1 Tax=Mycteria americana TaxID=33587 RepID=A0AAN7RY09_MYCAM|nr:hypothetical protein QYF61_024163 [Mycteria americana]
MESPNNPSVLKALKKKTVIQLKKQCCYVSMDYEGDLHDQDFSPRWAMDNPGQGTVLLPEATLPTEATPLKLPRDPPLGLAEPPEGTRPRQEGHVGNIVLSGGSWIFPGFPKRLCLELNALFHGTGCQIQVLVSPERGRAAWAGGSMAVWLTSFQHKLMAKGEYQEHGAEYVHRIFQ